MQLILQLNKFIIICLSYVIFLNSSSLYAQTLDDSWNVVRQQFKLDHQLNQPAVKKQLQWLVSHPKYLTKLAQAEPYIYHIITEIQKRNLPGEIALIPMLESAYNPFAYSGAGAAGLWQLMPKTGQHLGIKGDWWVDGRRSIHASTHAALNYFTHLARFFHGDWLLAIAAYDCGEGTIQRHLKANPMNKQSFWYLPLPQETQLYVPRLLALAEIIAHPEQYHVRLPFIPHEPYFEEVHIGTQIDLNHAARLAGISFRDLIKLNPGFNHWATSPNFPTNLLIPKKHVFEFHQNLAKLPKQFKTSFTKYIVKNGETFSYLTQHFHTNQKLLMQINHLQSPVIHPGQIIYIPSNESQQELAKFIPRTPSESRHIQNTPIAPRTYKILHIVQRNENIKIISKKYAISCTQIAKWNNLHSVHLKPGQHLFIWRQTNGNAVYVVKHGDTFNQIAKINHLSNELLHRLNPRTNPRYLKPGEKIRLV
jgi:membrane-bound lytic murein transglycosylase D